MERTDKLSSHIRSEADTTITTKYERAVGANIQKKELRTYGKKIISYSVLAERESNKIVRLSRKNPKVVSCRIQGREHGSHHSKDTESITTKKTNPFSSGNINSIQQKTQSVNNGNITRKTSTGVNMPATDRMLRGEIPGKKQKQKEDEIRNIKKENYHLHVHITQPRKQQKEGKLFGIQNEKQVAKAQRFNDVEGQGLKGFVKEGFKKADDIINERKTISIEVKMPEKRNAAENAAKYNRGTNGVKPLWSAFDQPKVTVKNKQAGLHKTNKKTVSANKYFRMLDPSMKGKIGRETGDRLRQTAKSIRDFPYNTDQKGMRKNVEIYSDRLNDNGDLGSKLTATAVSLPKNTVNAYHAVQHTKEGMQASIRLTWNSGKHMINAGRKVYNGSKKLKQFMKEEKKAAKVVQATRTFAHNTSTKMKQAAAKKVEKAAIKAIGIVPSLLLLVIVFAMMVVSVICMTVSGSEAAVPLADSNTIMGFKDYCEGLESFFYRSLDEIEKNHEFFKNCDKGNNDKCTIHVVDQEGNDTTVSDTWLPLYVLSVVRFNYDVSLMGVPYGNDSDDGETPIEDIEHFLDITFYKLAPWKEEDMIVNQETKTCTHGEDYSHDYTITDITVYISDFDALLGSMPWHTDAENFCKYVYNDWNKLSDSARAEALSTIGEERDADARDLYNELLVELSNSDGTPEEEWKSTVSVNINGDYTTLSAEEIEKLMKNAPTLPMTREEFVKFITKYCTPTGKIQYFWGGKSSPGWNSSFGQLKLVTAAGSQSTGQYRPFGLDCSGFVDWIYATAGVDLFGYNSTPGIWKLTVPISSADAQPGDLVFKQTPGSGGTNHVGIYIGETNRGKFAHCAGSTGTTINSYSGFVFYRRPIIKFKGED